VTDGRDEPGRGYRRFATLLALLLVVILVGLIALWFVAGRPYDPFVLSRSDNVRAKALSDAARAGPLTDAEFNESLALLKSPESIAQLMIICVLQLEAERDAGRREQIITALKALPPSTDANLQRAITTSLTRISEPVTRIPPGFGDYGPVHADSLKGKKSCWATGGSKARFVWEFDGDQFTIREDNGPIPDDALIAILGSRPPGEVKSITGKWALNDAERTMTLTNIKADGNGAFKDVTLRPFNTGVVRVNLNEKQYVFSPLR
jgi:hypothetical protein